MLLRNGKLQIEHKHHAKEDKEHAKAQANEDNEEHVHKEGVSKLLSCTSARVKRENLSGLPFPVHPACCCCPSRAVVVVVLGCVAAVPVSPVVVEPGLTMEAGLTVETRSNSGNQV